MESPGEKGRSIRSEPAFRKPVTDFHQPQLWPVPLSESIPEDDPCRLVVKLVAQLDLSGLKSRLKREGAPYYPLGVMLALELFSKWDGELGSRRVEKRCKFDIRYQFVCQGFTPDHATIWRFRRFLGEELDHLAVQAVKLGKKAGLVSLGRISLDGTKLPGAASQWRRMREAAEREDGDLAQSLEKGSDEEDAQDERFKQAATFLNLLKAPPKKWERAPCEDPDAKVLRARQGHYVVGYNAQFAVDPDTGMVMACHVTNEASDSGLLAPTLAKYLDLHGDLPGELVADAGYDTPLNAQLLSDLGIDGCIVCKERRPFWQLDEENRPVCPMGHVPVFESRFRKKSGVWTVRHEVKECPTCPLRRKCLAPLANKELPKQKTLSFDAGADPVHWIRQKLYSKTEAGRARLRERGKTSEFSFARLKERLRFRRITMWNLQGAKTEIGIMVLALNLLNLVEKVGIPG